MAFSVARGTESYESCSLQRRVVAQQFFGDGGYALVGPYSAEVWPAGLRGSGMGFGYGLGNFGKIIGSLGLALIVA
jgi:putative MFS transporter